MKDVIADRGNDDMGQLEARAAQRFGTWHDRRGCQSELFVAVFGHNLPFQASAQSGQKRCSREERSMGYHLTILRTVRRQLSPISPAELKDAVASLPGWAFQVQVDGPSEPQVTFSLHGREIVTLWHRNGEWWTPTPPEAALQPMVDLANRLQARLRGDEGETYRSAEDSYAHPDDLMEHAVSRAGANPALRKARRRRWLINALAAFAGIAFIQRCDQQSSVRR